MAVLLSSIAPVSPGGRGSAAGGSRRPIAAMACPEPMREVMRGRVSPPFLSDGKSLSSRRWGSAEGDGKVHIHLVKHACVRGRSQDARWCGLSSGLHLRGGSSSSSSSSSSSGDSGHMMRMREGDDTGEEEEETTEDSLEDDDWGPLAPERKREIEVENGRDETDDDAMSSGSSLNVGTGKHPPGQMAIQSVAKQSRNEVAQAARTVRAASIEERQQKQRAMAMTRPNFEMAQPSPLIDICKKFLPVRGS